MPTLFFDCTKAVRARYPSGLIRVSRRLLASLNSSLGEERVVPVRWSSQQRAFVPVSRWPAFIEKPIAGTAEDVFLSPEIFSPAERLGVDDWLARFSGTTAAIFHDLIPLEHPSITWPRSVARHPRYLSMLAGLDHIFTVSTDGVDRLKTYFSEMYWQMPTLTPMQLGADWIDGTVRQPFPSGSGAVEGRAPLVLQTGILEPRKQQTLVLDALEALRDQGESPLPKVVFVGRINPHFGRPIARRINRLKRQGLPVELRTRVGDEELAQLMAKASFTLFPSTAEGCGLPVLESLWAGRPVLASDLPSHRESSRFGGVRLFKSGDREALMQAMSRLCWDSEAYASLCKTAPADNTLPTWYGTARMIQQILLPKNPVRPGSRSQFGTESGLYPFRSPATFH